MAKTNQNSLIKWIALNDPNGAALKGGMHQGRLILVITGLQPRSQLFNRAINELGFTSSGLGKYLVKAVPVGEVLRPSFFHGLWPKATAKGMKSEDVVINFEDAIAKHRKKIENESLDTEAIQEQAKREREELENSISETLKQSTYLGRNKDGERVFQSVAGRFVEASETQLIYEDSEEGRQRKLPLFLRGRTQSDVRECAKGLLRACEKGESQNAHDLATFAATVLQKEASALLPEEVELIAQAIDSAILESLVENNPGVSTAWADATYYQEMMPGRAAFAPDSVTTPYLPPPIAIQIQRFLTSSQSVNVVGKIPGFGFGLLPDNTQVFVQDPDTLDWGSESFHRPDVDRLSSQTSPSEGGYWRMSGDTSEEQISDFFSNLTDDAIAVVTAGTLEKVPSIEKHARLIQTIKVPRFLTGTAKPIHILVLKKGEIARIADDDEQIAVATISNWNDLKTVVDESLLYLGKNNQDNEIAENKAQSTKRHERTENSLQRPYLAFSKTGEAKTMVPKNLQAPIASALSRLEEINGPIDQFVCDELGIGKETLTKNFLPEQVDAIGLIINRLQSGRGFILGDETGIGKGRTIAAIATWANKMDKRVIFMTQRSPLFSDIARDLIDIEEWNRFRPIITNSDGKILNIMGDAEELMDPLTPTEMKRLMSQDVKDLSANLIFTTYSQVNTEDSEKAKWLAEIARDALVICDESHAAAGSDSNVSKNVQTLVDSSWATLYSSATWAKSSKNLHLYSRAFPESISVTQVTSAMKEEGDAFSENFCSLMAMDGAFVRREHDESRVQYRFDRDEKNIEKNLATFDQVSEVLGMMAMVSGEINSMLQKLNGDVRAALTEAREARKQINSIGAEAVAQLKSQRAQLEREIQHATTLISSLEGEIEYCRERNAERFSNLTYQSGQLVDLGDPESLSRAIAERLDFNGPVTREELETTNQLTELKDNILSLMNQRDILARKDAELNGLRRVPELKKIQGSMFVSSFGTGGAIHQASRTVISALSVDHTVEVATEAFKEGRSPAIIIDQTGESFVRQFMEEEVSRIRQAIAEMRERQEGGTLTSADRRVKEIADALNSGAKESDVITQIRTPMIQDMLRGLLSRLGGIQIEDPNDRIDLNDGEESNGMTAMTTLSEIPGVDAAVIEKYMKGVEAINEKINSLPSVPIVTIDALRVKLQQAGLTSGEITGRQFELHPENGDFTKGVCTLVQRARRKTDVVKTISGYNSGAFDVLIMNGAAAAGWSGHASPRFQNKKQRHVIFMDLHLDPATLKQEKGRFDRTGQLSAPIVSIMQIGIPAQDRLMMMYNTKQGNLNSNVRSSRDGAGMVDVPDLLNKIGDKICQEYLRENPGIATRLSLSTEDIEKSYGFANRMTQRMTMLSSKDTLKVYDDLKVAYEDAVRENELLRDSSAIITRDWRARTIATKHAWGPTQHAEYLGAFDQPVKKTVVEFDQDYQPMHWDEVRGIIVQSTARLLADERVKPARAQSVIKESATGWSSWTSTGRINTENSKSDEEKKNQWASDILEYMASYIPVEALQKEGANEPKLTIDDFEADLEFEPESEVTENAAGENSTDEEKTVDSDRQSASTESRNSMKRSIERANKGFAALASHWIPVETRIPGTSVRHRSMALVSKSGKTAKLYFVNEKNQAAIYLINLDRAIQEYQQGPGAAFKELGIIENVKEDGWLITRFNQVWGSTDNEITLVDFSAATKNAATILKAKAHIALHSTGHATVESACADDKHNGVIEAIQRMNFVENTLSQLTPGTEIYLRSKNAIANSKSIEYYLGMSSQLICDVTIPEKGQESSLSRWKFHVAKPGSEKMTILSGALLYKMQVNIEGNIFAGNQETKNITAGKYNRFEKGVFKRTRNLLTGNMFQAAEWARATKEGSTIIYTDESGQRHRAIEIHSQYGVNKEMPLRLYGEEMLSDFFHQVIEASDTIHIPEDDLFVGQTRIHNLSTVFTSFKGAIRMIKDPDKDPQDVMVFEPSDRSFIWKIPKDQKERIRRSFRTAVQNDKAEWLRNHPEGEPYPVAFSTASPRRSSGSQTAITFKLPTSPEGRARFWKLFVQSQGLEIFSIKSGGSDKYRAYVAAKNAERNHFIRKATPSIEETNRRLELRERREAHRNMMEAAFGSSTVKAADQVQGELTDIRQNQSEDTSATSEKNVSSTDLVTEQGESAIDHGQQSLSLFAGDGSIEQPSMNSAAKLGRI